MPGRNYKGKCLEAAFEAACGLAVDKEQIFIVHGWRNGPPWVFHAWCEFENQVIDLTTQKPPLSREIYYEERGITEERLRRYPFIEYARLMTKKGNYGPFDRGLFSKGNVSLQDPLKEGESKK